MKVAQSLRHPCCLVLALAMVLSPAYETCSCQSQWSAYGRQLTLVHNGENTCLPLGRWMVQWTLACMPTYSLRAAVEQSHMLSQCTMSQPIMDLCAQPRSLCRIGPNMVCRHIRYNTNKKCSATQVIASARTVNEQDATTMFG